MSARTGLLAAAVAVAAVLAAACTLWGEDADGGVRSRDSRLLRPVSLPELSQTPGTIRERLEQAYASLQAKREDQSTPAADLAGAYGALGQLLMAAEREHDAEPYLLNARALAPDEARWTYYLAHVYRGRNDFAKAAALFARTVELRPADLAALVYLGDAYLLQGQLDAAEPPFRKALSLEPRLAVALFGLGRVALAREDHRAAVRHLEQALILDPQASIIHYPLAMAYRGVGELDKADAHLRRRGEARVTALPDPLMEELRRAAASAQSYELMGTRSLSKGEWAAAAGYLRKAVDLAPRNPTLNLKLAEALRRAGRADEALRYYDEAIGAAPGTGAAEARFGYAMALVRLQRYSDARDRLSEGVARHPGEPAFAHALARLLAAAPDERVRDGRRALAMTRELLERQKTPDLYETTAMALAAVGQFQEAATLQRELIAAATRTGHDGVARRLGENLKRYEARQPSRHPWPDEAMP